MKKIVLSILIPVFLIAKISELKTLTISTGNNYVEIELAFTSTPANIHDFMLKNPARVVVDAEGTRYALGSNIFPVNQGAVLRVRGSQFKTEPMVARVVVDLKKAVKYEVIRDENSVKVKVYTEPASVGYKKTVKSTSKGSLKTTKGNTMTVQKKTTKSIASSQSVISVGAKFFYNSRGRRDPFKPIAETSTKQDTLLDVAKAKLIGIIQDSTGYVALVEDKNGNGFILRRGDRVKRGRVVRVTKDMAVFAISDFGFTRTVILKLEKEEVSK